MYPQNRAVSKACGVPSKTTWRPWELPQPPGHTPDPGMQTSPQSTQKSRVCPAHVTQCDLVTTAQVQSLELILPGVSCVTSYPAHELSSRPQFGASLSIPPNAPHSPSRPLCASFFCPWRSEEGLVLSNLKYTHLGLQVEILLTGSGPSGLLRQKSPPLDTPGSGLSASSQLRLWALPPLCFLILPLNLHFSLVRNPKVPPYSFILLALCPSLHSTSA